MILNRLKLWLKKRQFKNRSTITDSRSLFISHTAKIRLEQGSTNNDVCIGRNCMVHGLLFSLAKGKIMLGDYVFIGTSSKVFSVEGVKIGGYTQIANDVCICDNNNHPVNPLDRIIVAKASAYGKARSWRYSDHAPICIGENCWIGEHSRICKGVTIGDGSIVAANSVVTKNVPANCIVAGNPARIVKTDIDNTHRFFNDKL